MQPIITSPSANNCFSINTQVIIQNRAFSLARYLGLLADNYLDGQNGSASSRFATVSEDDFALKCFFSSFLNNHLCIYTKTIIRLRLSDYRLNNHLDFVSVNIHR